jgi:hypothetical protein
MGVGGNVTKATDALDLIGKIDTMEELAKLHNIISATRSMDGGKRFFKTIWTKRIRNWLYSQKFYRYGREKRIPYSAAYDLLVFVKTAPKACEELWHWIEHAQWAIETLIELKRISQEDMQVAEILVALAKLVRAAMDKDPQERGECLIIMYTELVKVMGMVPEQELSLKCAAGLATYSGEGA